MSAIPVANARRTDPTAALRSRRLPIVLIAATAVVVWPATAAVALAAGPPTQDEQDSDRDSAAQPRDGQPQDAQADQPGEDRPPPDRGRPRRGRFRDRFDGRGGSEWGRDRVPPEEFINEVLEAIRDRLPRLHERLTSLREKEPQRFNQLVRRSMPLFREFMMMRERRPEVADGIIRGFEIEDRLHGLARQYRSAGDDAALTEQLGAQIEALVREQFSLRQKLHAARLEEFAERLREQQQRLEQEQKRLHEMEARMEEMVHRRVQDLKQGRMSPPDELGSGPWRKRHGKRGGPHGPPPDHPPRPDEPPPDEPRPAPPPPPED